MTRTMSLLLAVVFVFSMFAGCGKSSEDAETISSETVEATEDSVDAVPSENGDTAPVKEPPESDGSSEESSEEASIDTPIEETVIAQLCDEREEISVWVTTLMSIENNTESINELTAIQEYEKKTNVHVNWTQVSMGASSTQFNLMVASGDYCDIISGFATLYSAGLRNAVEENIIVDLTDRMQELAPHYYSYVRADEDVLKEVSTDDGAFLSFYSIFEEDYTPTSGPMIRQDWLDDLGLDTPVTYDDWKETALAFRSAYDCSDAVMVMSDLTFGSSFLSGGYNIAEVSLGGSDLFLYQDNGVVKSSLTEPALKDYLQMLHTWYQEGVITQDYLSNPSGIGPDLNGYISSGNTGIFYGDAVSMVAYGNDSGDAGFELSGIAAPKLHADDAANGFGGTLSRVQPQNGTAVITSGADVELCIQWLDNWFTDEAYVLANYGVEGLANSIEEDGVRRYTDLVLHNPNGLTQQAATVIYTVTFIPAVLTQENRFSIWEDYVLDAVQTWNDSVDGTKNLPTTISITIEESEAYTSRASNIATYAAESIAKFVLGDRDLNEFDAFTGELRDMGIAECLEIYQAALERYSKR